MKFYGITTRCAICGGEGVASTTIAAKEWFGAKLVHTDPAICRFNLEKLRTKLEKLQTESPAPEAEATGEYD